MPTYEYRCQKCKREFEVMQSMRDKALATCDECGGKLKRLIGSGAGIIFKGSGFYCTDYRSPSYASSAKNDSAPAPSATPKSDPKSAAGTAKSEPAKSESTKSEPAKSV